MVPSGSVEPAASTVAPRSAEWTENRAEGDSLGVGLRSVTRTLSTFTVTGALLIEVEMYAPTETPGSDLRAAVESLASIAHPCGSTPTNALARSAVGADLVCLTHDGEPGARSDPEPTDSARLHHSLDVRDVLSQGDVHRAIRIDFGGHAITVGLATAHAKLEVVAPPADDLVAGVVR